MMITIVPQAPSLRWLLTRGKGSYELIFLLAETIELLILFDDHSKFSENRMIGEDAIEIESFIQNILTFHIIFFPPLLICKIIQIYFTRIKQKYVVKEEKKINKIYEY